MRKELGLLNIICIIVALGFVGMAVASVISSGDFLTTDNLFIITVSLLMALVFVINPLLYLKSEGRLPLPGMAGSPLGAVGVADVGSLTVSCATGVDAVGVVAVDVEPVTAESSWPASELAAFAVDSAFFAGFTVRLAFREVVA